MEEIRGRLDDPGERLYRRAWASVFRGALAHPVSGNLASVARIAPADVVAFLRRRLAHPNTVLAVVGGVGLDSVRSAVRRSLPSRRARRPRPRAAGALGQGADGSQLRDHDSSQAYLATLLPVSAAPRSLLATGVAVDIVGADPDSRLFQELRERLGLSYEVGAHLDWGPDWALAVISASGARSRADRLARAVSDTCRHAAAAGFTADELERARKKLRYRYATLADSRLDQAIAFAESALWGFPTPEETERIVATLSPAEIEQAWRRAVAGRGVTAILQ